MVKRNMVGKVQDQEKRTPQQVAEDCVRVLCDQTVTHWISNGEDEKVGRAVSVSSDKKGLRIHLDTGKVVVWKCGKAAIHAMGPMLVGRFGWTARVNGTLALV